MPLPDHRCRPRPTFYLSKRVMFIVTCLLSIDIVFSSSDTEVSTELRKPPRIGWINPDEVLFNDFDVKERSIGWIDPDEMVDDELNDWVNPFDKTGGSKFKNNNIFSNEKEANNMRKSLGLNKCETYMQRFINLLLRYSGLKDVKLQSGSEHVHFKLVISHQDLAVLQKFGNSGNGLFDVGSVLTKLFDSKEEMDFESHSSTHESGPTPGRLNFSRIRNYFAGYINYIFSSSEMIIISSVVGAWLLTFWSTYITGSYRMPIINLVILIFAAGYGMTWMRMYQEQEAKRFQTVMKDSEVPRYCRGELSLYERIYYTFFQGIDCEQYFKIKLVDPFVKVSPTVVLSETISHLFLHPTKYIAQAYGDFITTSIGSVPWYLKLIIIPISFLVPLILVFGIVILLLGMKININPFTGLTIFPKTGGQRNEEVKDKEERKYIEEINDDKRERRKTDDKVGYALSMVNKPLILMNWAAFKKVKASNKNIELDDVNSEVKSIASDCLSDFSEDTDVIIKKRENKGKDKKCQTTTFVESPTFSGGSGDSVKATNRASAKEKVEAKKKTTHNTKDTETPSLSRTKSNVQQWLDDNCTP